jgi:hypothetical protein
MAEPALDLQWYVATAYELRRVNELPAKDQKIIENKTPLRHLVQTGTPKLVRPKHEALDMAVRVLLKTRIPKLMSAYERGAFIRWVPGPAGKLDPDEVSILEKNVLLLTPYIGMLSLAGQSNIKYPPGYLRHESLDQWISLATTIQNMFTGRHHGRELDRDKEHSFGRLSICLSYKDGRTSMSLRPEGKRAALIYHAAQLIAGGTRLQNCSYCGGPFLSGGENSSATKKRGDARFCSDKCRSGYHNEMRRKTRKSKL